MQQDVKYELKSFNDKDFEVLLRIKFDETVSNDRIKMFGISARKCHFDDEITSDYGFYPFGSYTKNLCTLEYRIKTAIQMCGCRPFFYKIGKLNHSKFHHT